MPSFISEPCKGYRFQIRQLLRCRECKWLLCRKLRLVKAGRRFAEKPVMHTSSGIVWARLCTILQIGVQQIRRKANPRLTRGRELYGYGDGYFHRDTVEQRLIPLPFIDC